VSEPRAIDEIEADVESAEAEHDDLRDDAWRIECDLDDALLRAEEAWSRLQDLEAELLDARSAQEEGD